MENVNRSGRAYGQYCAVARALDIVGDRWNLLIVRDLLPGPLRFTELRTSLGGPASNLLTARLRDLEAHGVVVRTLTDHGPAYALTPWGQELRDPMEALGRWGAPLLARGRGGDAFRPRWLVSALPALLRGRTAAPPVEVGLDVESELIMVRLDDAGAHAELAPRVRPATVLTASPEVVVEFAAGARSVDRAVAAGRLEGDIEPIRRAFGGPTGG